MCTFSFEFGSILFPYCVYLWENNSCMHIFRLVRWLREKGLHRVFLSETWNKIHVTALHFIYVNSFIKNARTKLFVFTSKSTLLNNLFHKRVHSSTEHAFVSWFKHLNTLLYFKTPKCLNKKDTCVTSHEMCGSKYRPEVCTSGGAYCMLSLF